MTAPLDVPESTTQTLAPVAGPGAVAGRSPWQIAWTRLKRDKVALAGGQINLVGHDEETARIEVHEVHGKDLKIEINGDRLDIDHPQVAWNNFLEVFRNFGPNSAKATISLLVPRAVALTFGTVTVGGHA